MSDSRPQSIIDLISPTQQIQRPSMKTEKLHTSSEEGQMMGRCRIARQSQMMLAIRLCSGEVEVLPYATLARIRSDDSDQKLRLSFMVGQIVIEGERLTRIFHYLCEHRVQELCQSDRSECLTENEDVCIHSIVMKLRDPV